MASHGNAGRAVAVCAVAALALAACGSSSKKSSTSGTTAASAGGSGSGVKCSGLAIGFFGALTGDSANLGLNEKGGTKLAIDQFNKANPGCQVSFKTYDSQGDPAQAPALAQQAVSDSSVVALIGPAFSGESKVADPIFDQGGLPLVTASATNPVLSTHGWKVFHRAVGNDNSQGPAAAKYITGTLNAKKVFVIDDASEYGKGIADIVRTKAKDGGAEVGGAGESIDPKATDFSSTVNKVKGFAPDAVFFGGYYQAGGILAKQLKDAGVTATFVGPDGVNDKGFVTAAGAAAEGAVLLAPGTPVSKAQGADKFVTDYKSDIGTDPGLYSLEAFDAANAELAAISAGSTTRKAITDYLATADYKGIVVELKWDSKGELASTVTIWASKVQGGAITAVSPINT